MQSSAVSSDTLARSRHGVQGFTAIELMVVIAIVAVLASLALPSFDHTIKRWQLSQATNALTDTIYFARSEAVKYGGNVSIRQLPDTTECSGSGSTDWSCGWQVVLNPIPEGAVGIPADGVLKRVQANEKNTITSDNIQLNQWGNPDPSAATLNVQHKRHNGDPAFTQSLCLSTGGRLAAC